MDANGALSLAFDPVLNALRVTGGVGAGVSDAAYDEAAWNGVTTLAPSKNALRDLEESRPQLAPDDEGLLSWSTVGLTTKPIVEAGLARQAALDLTNAIVNAYAIPLYATLAASAAVVNNSTTPVDVTGLVLPVAANAQYEFNGYLVHRADVAADGKFVITLPTGCNGAIGPGGISTSATTTEAAFKTNSQNFTNGVTMSTGGAGVTTDSVIRPHGILKVGGTAGNLQIQYAQNSAHASDAQVRIHSSIVLRRVA